MKTKLLILVVLGAGALAALAGELSFVNVGAEANDRSGDSLRVAFQKVNTNFARLAGVAGVLGPGMALEQRVIGQAGYWYWTASIGTHGLQNEFTTLLSSPDGLNWTRLVAGTMYADPDCYSNNVNGPITTEFVPYVDYDQGCLWGIYNYDPYNTNPDAQALALARSYDMTNWTRVSLLYLMGKKPQAAMFAATWFDDPGGKHYIVGAYKEGAFNIPKDLYVWERLDNTFTNWGPGVKIMAAGTGTGAKWDAWLMKAGSTYQLFYTDGNGQLAVAHRGDLGGLFTFDKELDTIDGIAYGLEAPAVFQMTAATWRLYGRSGIEVVAESPDAGVTWPIDPEPWAPHGFYPNTSSPDGSVWHGPGILRMSKPLTNYFVRALASTGPLTIKSNSVTYLLPITMLAPGDTEYFSSNGVAYVRGRNWLGAGWTNKLGGP